MNKRRVIKSFAITLLITLFTSLLLVTQAAKAANTPNTLIVYVDIDATGANNGTSWANAYNSLYIALSGANSGTEIWVAEGVYKPTTSTNRAFTFYLRDGVEIYGGFAGNETQRSQRDFAAHVTTLSGDLNGDDGANFANNSENSYHVVVGATGGVLDGFVITGGNANGSNPFDRGGGILNNAANPVLSNLTINANTANIGAGMYNDAAQPTLTNVVFSNNVASYSGGGMQNYTNSSPTINTSTFYRNSAQFGGGMFNNASSPTLMNVVFESNLATTQYGGGIHDESNSRPLLTNVTFKSNSANKHGGGMFNNGSTPTLTNVTFSGNTTTTADSWGGGMSNWGSSPVLTNVTFSGNSTFWNSGGGGAIANFSSSRPQIRNSILWGNWGLNGPQIFNASSNEASTLKNSVIPGCPTNSVCTEIITSDPRLGTLGNYGGFSQTLPLLPGSSAIDATTNNCPTADQRGVARSTPLCDIGAFESRGFSMTITGGNHQSAGINKVFPSPLSVLVTSAFSEPVAGGRVSFTPPAADASATLNNAQSTISADGSASVTATANGTPGSYQVLCAAAGANSLNFALTNLQTYSVTYNGNNNTGGTAPVDGTSPYLPNQLVTVLGNTGNLVRVGYTFSGWNSQPDGLGTQYDPGNSFLMPSNNLALYARWVLNIYTVKFDTQGGSTLPDQTVAHGGLVIRPTDPTRAGFGFVGWFTAPSGGSAWDFEVNTVTANLTLYGRWVDTSQPSVTAFSAPSPVLGPDIPITSFSGTDNVAVVGYLITQSSEPPSASAAGWTTTAPTSYLVSENGIYSLYPWVKDAAGNISAPYSNPAVVKVGNEPPEIHLTNTITSLPEDTDTLEALRVADIQVVDDGLGTNVLSLSGIDADLFEIIGDHLYLKAGTVLDYETKSSLEVTVEVDDSTVGLSPDDSESLVIAIEDVDEINPEVLSIIRLDPNPTSADEISFKVTFSEDVIGFTELNLSLTTSGVNSAAVTSLIGSGAEYIVTVSTGTGNGSIRLDITGDGVTDLVGNALTGLPYEKGQSYDVVKIIPIYLPLIFRSV